MKLIVGLGNPGKEYAGTRHNCGFMVIDRLASKLNVNVDQNKFKGLYAKVKYHGEDIILLKPQTYMNLSGESVNAVMNFFKIDKEDLLVIYDDLDMPVGKLRLRKTGSAGGHNGIKNIIAHLNSQDFKRIRVGIDRHKYMNVADYVLSRFSKVESEAIEQGIENAANAVLDYLDNDFNHAMNYYN
ncbi:aminoacyl-tRNA hydrolase [Thomasclavelia spiroformis]|jgi:PTH1 family peptidyl-tRNA hydrolase|uniref:aminoacyl-tRNA hydrolase n=1 Tax=Thomasclavelia spiroformis TaxID=29348 RepID=UPI00241EB83F|nr:aminoacyl-tRNA hydrolase [Thomasclavelia spiroformis]